MRKTIITLLAILIIPVALVAAERMVLGELFTSTTCGPCVGANHSLNTLLAEKNDYLAVIRYHMSWPSPGNDPYYHHNSNDNGARRSYYGDITGVPKLKIDGVDALAWGFTVDEHHDAGAPFAMKMYREFSPFEAQGTGTARIILVNEEETSMSFILYGALTESNIQYTGTNGDPEHHQAMLYLIPGREGFPVTLESLETRIMEFEYDVTDTVIFPPETEHIVDSEDCELVFWCQVAQTKEVIQAAKAAVSTQTSIGVADVAVTGELNPGGSVDVIAKINNTSEQLIEDITVWLEVDNEDITVTKNMAEIDSIEAGATHSLEAGLLELTANSSYDGSEFTITCFAGEGGGSMSSATGTSSFSSVAETVSPDFSLSSPGLVDRNFQISLSLPGSARTEVVILDVSGRKIANLYSGNKPGGKNLIDVTVEDLKNGVYFIKATSAGKSEIQKFLLLK